MCMDSNFNKEYYVTYYIDNILKFLYIAIDLTKCSIVMRECRIKSSQMGVCRIHCFHVAQREGRFGKKTELFSLTSSSLWLLEIIWCSTKKHDLIISCNQLRSRIICLNYRAFFSY